MTRPPPPHPDQRRPLFWRVFPLVWLVYLYFPLAELFRTPHPVPILVLNLTGVGIFVGLWWRLYSRQGHHPQTHGFLVAFTAGWCFFLYATSFPALGFNAATFLVYAAGVLGFQGNRVVLAFGYLGVLAALLVPWQFGVAQIGLFDLAQMLLLSAVAMWGNHASHRQNVARVRLAQVQAEKEALAADAERERIARDLHDLLGHTLSVIVLKSELASKLAERDPARAAQEIREVERISREALTEVRAAVSGYRGSGLRSELARAKVALDAAGVRLEYGGQECPLPPEVEHSMGMVLREAVTNVVRHARAGECRVSITREMGGYRLEIADNGVGGEAPEGTGLTSMRERVRALGGEFSRSGTAGTRVVAKFPEGEGGGRRAEGNQTPGAPPSALRPLPDRSSG
ncbi:sensor histidine kinase [Deinococcus hopiensis]|uniref:Two-component system, NarL family, sensor histidine kinase DesK n=1 Tax=Deinococcus hopiensis KR-140 TaxID=695939 RepID=A0A1W1V685_9DEIO|nr:sensor histidine kinase [Deinococcus hopiensis]SMB88775.1 two-component system, NarL family, sensor histidine kinase DesK [Deinococcus hopiensis KR-140]